MKYPANSAIPYRADLVRIIHGDANPGGPGLKFEEVPASFAGILPIAVPALPLGSCGLVLVKSEPGQPATLGSSAAAGVSLIVWCRDYHHQVKTRSHQQAQRYGAEMAVPRLA